MESQWRRVSSSVGSDRLAARWQMTRRRGRHSAKSKKLRQPCSTGAAWSCRRVIARVRPQAPYGARPACRIVPVSWGRLHRLGSSRSQRFEREGSPSAFGCLSSCPPQLRDGAQEVRGNSPTNVGKTEIDRVDRETGQGPATIKTALPCLPMTRCRVQRLHGPVQDFCASGQRLIALGQHLKLIAGIGVERSLRQPAEVRR